MYKLNISLILVLAAAVLGTVAFGQTGSAIAQGEPPVGVVVAYIPGQSITIVDQTGTQHEYMLSSTLKILPPGRANSLAVGSFVTIIAPASLDHGKQTAAGIVIHPHVPGGWTVPSQSATPLTTGTAAGTFTATPTGAFLATDTATPTQTATGTPIATDTATSTGSPTIVGTTTDTPTATATPTGGGSAASTNAFIEWLAALFRQLLTNQ